MKSLTALSALLLCHLHPAHVRAIAPPRQDDLHALAGKLEGEPGGDATDTNGTSPRYIFRAAAPLGNVISNAEWTVTCDSQVSGNECAKAIDGNTKTFWHSYYSGAESAKLPHHITVDMGATEPLTGVSVLPRQDGNTNGIITEHNVEVSTNNETWHQVATGTWHGDSAEKFANFEPINARYVRLTAHAETKGNQWSSIAELKMFKATRAPLAYAGTGKWGLTLNFPIVPVAAAVLPSTGKVLTWSAHLYDQFGNPPGAYTVTSQWNREDNHVSERSVTETQHDMFCPGISMDVNGRVVVTGGNSAKRTTIYDDATNGWIAAPDMKVARGYQSSVTCSDGRIFTIGGSWSGGVSVKNGEIYSPTANTWTALNGALVDPMLTKDKGGRYRADNHAWFFGWKSQTVFQAGPSTAMHWYFTNSPGGVKGAGNRASTRGTDPDAMCGTATMFDAVNGKILTAGGSPSYENASASTHAHLITIQESTAPVKVEFASNGMFYPRIFHNSIVLPDGTVFITGGQSYGVPFADSTPQLTPELYNPKTNSFTKQQPNSIVRVYHSVGILLPDATVFSGGGGLCGSCSTNHFDAQIFTPAYLLTADGSPATRPTIESVSGTKFKAGATLSFTTGGGIASASIIRYGSATHTVNTDQRRIPLTISSGSNNQHSAKLPSDYGILTPGYYMLFVLNDNGTPSVAKTIQVTL